MMLYLTIKKKWFDMLGNPKTDEYREVNDYWRKRLMENCEFKKYTGVLFANGGHFGNVPKKEFKVVGISIGLGKPEWGAEEGKNYFIIHLLL